jgi:divalent metal cation (Fe/Co/Zn/Cd) transporter
MAWMTVEAAVAVTAGILASSAALVGFGLDSVIEFCAAAIVVWQLRGEGAERQTCAVRLIGITFFVLAAYLAVEGIVNLATKSRPEHSVPGLAVTAAALVVMPGLALAKRRTGRALGNRTLIADAAESAFCAFTSAAALLGVGLNAGLGWWWADPAAALVIAALAVKKASKPGKKKTTMMKTRKSAGSPLSTPPHSAAVATGGSLMLAEEPGHDRWRRYWNKHSAD